MQPKIVGIVNITEDSFSDGGRFVQADHAIAHARQLAGDGADIIELGPASSHPDAQTVSEADQIARLAPVLEALSNDQMRISVDATLPGVQRYAMAHGAAIVNDIQGFPDTSVYPDLAASGCTLVMMHSVVHGEKAGYVDTDPATILDTISRFFENRIAALSAGGVNETNIVLDPGMGFFLGTNPAVSLTVLRQISILKDRFGLPVMVCVSRKSFLQKITDRTVSDVGAATLAAELYAADQGVDYIRTHDVRALNDAITVDGELRA